MNKKERDVLHSLCEGDITFSEAASKLGITEIEIGEMLDDFNWLPSLEKLAELSETEMETLSYIREICQPISSRHTVSNARTEIPIYFTPIMNYIETVPNETELNIGVSSYFSFEIFKPESINLSSENTKECFTSSSQSISMQFQLMNTQSTKKTLII